VVLTVGDRSLEIYVKDKGQNPKPFHVGHRLDIDYPPTDGHAGLGIFLIKHLVDEVEFSAKPQGGQVRMVIYLEPKNGDTL
jgi:anti-sigma regulatory factor (Ser/Thr protein kinase)